MTSAPKSVAQAEGALLVLQEMRARFQEWGREDLVARTWPLQLLAEYTLELRREGAADLTRTTEETSP